MSNETSGELLPRIMVYLLQLGVIRWEFLVEYMKPSMTFDNLYNEMAYLKYEFVYGTYDFSQQKIIWDILYNYIVSLHHECFGVCVFSSFESKNDLGHSLH